MRHRDMPPVYATYGEMPPHIFLAIGYLDTSYQGTQRQEETPPPG